MNNFTLSLQTAVISLTLLGTPIAYADDTAKATQQAQVSADQPAQSMSHKEWKQKHKEFKAKQKTEKEKFKAELKVAKEECKTKLKEAKEEFKAKQKAEKEAFHSMKN